MPRFDLAAFTPYLLAMAAEAASDGFARTYRGRYGMLRTEWRVLFHLGRHGRMTAREICDHSGLHKTKVSRAVAALEDKRFLSRARMEGDRRREALMLTRAGTAALAALTEEAARYDAALTGRFTPEEREVLHRCLRLLAVR